MLRLCSKYPARAAESKCNCPCIGTGEEKSSLFEGGCGEISLRSRIIKEKLCFCLGAEWKECLGKGLWLHGSLLTEQSRIPQHTEEDAVDGTRDTWVNMGLTEWGHRGKEPG